jgi:hypothetical protein
LNELGVGMTSLNDDQPGEMGDVSKSSTNESVVASIFVPVPAHSPVVTPDPDPEPPPELEPELEPDITPEEPPVPDEPPDPDEPVEPDELLDPDELEEPEEPEDPPELAEPSPVPGMKGGAVPVPHPAIAERSPAKQSADVWLSEARQVDILMRIALLFEGREVKENRGQTTQFTSARGSPAFGSYRLLDSL